MMNLFRQFISKSSFASHHSIDKHRRWTVRFESGDILLNQKWANLCQALQSVFVFAVTLAENDCWHRFHYPYSQKVGHGWRKERLIADNKSESFLVARNQSRNSTESLHKGCSTLRKANTKVVFSGEKEEANWLKNEHLTIAQFTSNNRWTGDEAEELHATKGLLHVQKRFFGPFQPFSNPLPSLFSWQNLK